MDNDLKNGSKTVHIAYSITFNDDLSLPKYINTFFCLLVSLILNTINCFELVDALRATLQNSLSPLIYSI